MSWADLPAELQDVIRRELLDPLAAAMLSLTCHRERARWRPGLTICAYFDLACAQGALGICEVLYAMVEDWTFDSLDTIEDGRVPARYTTLLDFDEALMHGHMDVADWAQGKGLRLSDAQVARIWEFGALDAFVWVVAHEYM